MGRNYIGHTDGLGGQVPDDGVGDGNLVITIMCEKHEVYERSGDNLETRVNITLFEALLGFNLELEHLDNHTVEVFALSAYLGISDGMSIARV